MRKEFAVRLVLIVQDIAERHPKNLRYFFKARKRRELLAIHRIMGIGSDRPTRQQIAESQHMGIEGHYELLSRIWPERYRDPRAPRRSYRVQSFTELVALRAARFASRIHLYCKDDQIEVQEQPKQFWNYLTEAQKSVKRTYPTHFPKDFALRKTAEPDVNSAGRASWPAESDSGVR